MAASVKGPSRPYACPDRLILDFRILGPSRPAALSAVSVSARVGLSFALSPHTNTELTLGAVWPSG